MNVHQHGARKWLKDLLIGLIGLAAASVLALTTATTAHAQKNAGSPKNFSSPEAAMNAFGDAVLHNREEALREILGKDFRAMIPPVDAGVRQTFDAEWGRSHAIRQTSESRADITVGDAGWTLPIPLVKTDQGWHFDMHAGAEEIRLRRIGRNELAVIQTMLAIYDAQREYAQTSHDGQGEFVYASKLVSSPGKHDGLYWPTTPDEPPSPLGQAFVDAVAKSTASGGYHGYHYKLLDSQGPRAPGGAYDYRVRGKLFGGFAVIAWPVKYGDTGIKSFMVSHAGQVYERDLGPDSTIRAEAIRSFDPGPDWDKVPADDSQ
jgi:hypothetical protein